MINVRFTILIVFALSHGLSAAEFKNPEAIRIVGYTGHAMEPYLSRDDRILLFNNINDPKVNTDLHWATRISPARFRYRGKIKGVNTRYLEGVPSMDRGGNLYFVSLRSYKKTLATIYRGVFTDGRVSHVEIVRHLSRNKYGAINFDAEISADGKTIYAVDGVFTGGAVPKSANIFLARLKGRVFERAANSAALFARINTPDLEYAPAISQDEKELFFTRMSGKFFWRKLKIMHATRQSNRDPFGDPKTIKAISGFVEAPTLSSDGRSLYYHKKVKGSYQIYRVTR